MEDQSACAGKSGANRMAILGITMVVFCLAIAINTKGADLRKSDLAYAAKEEDLEQQVAAEEERARKLEEYKIYVKTKQYAEEVAKEKLGLVNPDEILLKPSEVTRPGAGDRPSEHFVSGRGEKGR